MDPNIIFNPEKSSEYNEHSSMAHLVIANLTKAGDKVVLVSGITSGLNFTKNFTAHLKHLAVIKIELKWLKFSFF